MYVLDHRLDLDDDARSPGAAVAPGRTTVTAGLARAVQRAAAPGAVPGLRAVPLDDATRAERRRAQDLDLARAMGFVDEPAPVAAVGAPVQRKAGGDETEDVHAAASRGIATPTTAMPYAERIQQSFGPGFDIAGIRAHVGGDSAAAMGATAFAAGNHVVFDAAPDLHTAAHEAAHVFQQAHGVSLSGGVGQVGDAYERHADAVADRVVAGASAAALLGELAAPGARAASGAGGSIQRSPKTLSKKENEAFCKASWIRCDKSSEAKPKQVVAVHKIVKPPAGRSFEPELSNGKGTVMVEMPTGFTGPFVRIYLVTSDGTPIRGGTGLLAISSKKEVEVEVDKVAADAVDGSTRAVVLEKEADYFARSKMPEQEVPVLELLPIGPDKAFVRLGYGMEEGAYMFERAFVFFDDDLSKERRMFEAHVKEGRQAGNSFVDFVIHDRRIHDISGNLLDAVAKKRAFAIFMPPEGAALPKKPK
jgi:Domain of unknown function (DUF4157)